MQTTDRASISGMERGALINMIEEKDAIIKSKDNEIRLLEFTLEKYRRMLNGQKSEKNLPTNPSDLEPELSLFSDEEHRDAEHRLEEVEKEEEKQSAETVEVPAHTRRKAHRTIDYSSLEVRERIIDHEYINDKNRDDYDFIGEEVTDLLVTEPKRLYIDRVRRPKYALKAKLQKENPDRKAILIANLPETVVFPGCLAGISTLADIVIQKFFYHMPHYRLQQQYKECGLAVPSSTINDWFNKTCDLMRLLYNALRRDLMKVKYIHCDETFFDVLDEATHKVKRVSMWALCDALGSSVLFLYEFGKKNGGVAREILKSYNGVIQTDASALYEQFENDPSKIMLGCLVHARRYLINGRMEDAKTADIAIAAINKLYSIEHDADIAGLSYDERRDLRQREAYPILQDLEKYLSSKAGLYVEKSPMNKAIGYILRHVTKAVIMRLMAYCSPRFSVFKDIPARGGEVKKKIQELNILAKQKPVILLTDLDTEDCAPFLKKKLLKTAVQSSDFLLNIAIDEAEAWLMADRNGLAQYFCIDVNHIPSAKLQKMGGMRYVNEMDFSCKSSFELTHRIAPMSSNAELKQQISVVGKATKGKEYNSAILPFIRDKWNVTAAMQNSDSLSRMVHRLKDLEKRIP